MKKEKLFLSAFVVFLFSSQIYFSLPVYASQGGLPQLIRVGLERDFKNVSQISIENTYLNMGYNVNGVFTVFDTVQSASGFTVTADSSGQMILYSGTQAILTLDDSIYPIQIKDGGGGNIILNGTPYMNTIELYRAAKQNITAVNVLTPDEYLYSVVPSEMSVSFHPEALRAQSVAARNYLLTRMGIHKNQGYDMCDTAHCMLYRGASQNHDASTAAVNSTAGQLIYYQGSPINATFFSSSGGTTDDAENVWVENVPYLRGVDDSFEHEPRTWTRTFTWNEITSLLIANNISIGTANNLAITKTGVGGRVLELTIYATSGHKELTKEEIRTFFTSSSGGSLESRNFTLIGGNVPVTYLTATNGIANRTSMANAMYVLLPNGQDTSVISVQPSVLNLPVLPEVSGGTGVTITGRGWGHGVGMSQKGAEGLARMGYTYRDILLHYYTGVEIY